MKFFLKLFYSLFLVIVFVSLSEAQEKAIGIRLGAPYGLSFKLYKNQNTALEVIVSSNHFDRGLFLTGLYEKSQTAFNENGLDFFYGIGGHIGFFQGGFYRSSYYGKDYYSYPGSFVTIGIDLIAGLEYKIPNAPFTIGVDVKPTIEIFHPVSGFLDGGITFRYIFN